MKITHFLFVLSLLFWGCKDCGDTSSETRIRLEFEFVQEPVFEKIIAVGANREVFLVKRVLQEDRKPYYYLPISSTENATIYYFFRQGQIDTLEISYERKMVFTSNECGFRMNLEKLDIEKNTLSTRASISDGKLNSPFGGDVSFDPYIKCYE
jgi:hypothetical protein